MSRAVLVIFLSMFVVLVAASSSIAEEDVLDQPYVEVQHNNAFEPLPEKEDVSIVTPKAEIAHKHIDERISAVEEDAQEKIKAIVEEINQLDDRSGEGELQKKIGNIKLDAEIARLQIQMEIAEDKEDFVLASMMEKEIDHLENPDKPAADREGEQSTPRAEPAR